MNSYNLLPHHFPEETLLIISLMLHTLEYLVFLLKVGNLIVQLPPQEVFLLPCIVHCLWIDLHLVHSILLPLKVISVGVFFLGWMAVTFTFYKGDCGKWVCISPTLIITIGVSSCLLAIFFIWGVCWGYVVHVSILPVVRFMFLFYICFLFGLW